MNTTQPGSSLVIDTKEVGRRPGSMTSLSRTIEAPADLGTDVIAVPEGQEIDLDLRLESVVEGVLVTGTGSAVATGACVRCLTEVHPTVDIRFQELFVWPDRVDHHREVVAIHAKVVQQHVQALRLRDEDGGAQHAAHVEFFFGVIAQQVFREQHTDDVVAIALVDRIARVRFFQHVGDEFGGIVRDVDRVHLCAGHHDVAGAEFGHLEHALDHRQRVGVDQVALVGVLEDLQEFRARVGLRRDKVGQTLEE
mgnify:CR=1 FL=1